LALVCVVVFVLVLVVVLVVRKLELKHGICSLGVVEVGASRGRSGGQRVAGMGCNR
jgi:hypothetical protein